MTIEAKLETLGLKLPPTPAPAGIYVGAKQTGNLVFSAGQGPFATTKRGMVGKDLTIDEGYQAARESCLRCLSQLKSVIGDLDRIKQVIQVVGFINSEEGFMQQPLVLNGFTELLVQLLGPEAGKPTRTALPVHHPGWIAVEAWMAVELKT
jgi:enamine deaminase RidA (YjgF/YER057c/UK114 family)